MEEEYSDMELNETDSLASTTPLFGVSLLQLVVSASAITLNTLVLVVGLLRIKGSIEKRSD
ncbi:hypothetical protein Tcan_07483 [Toxocara canis]|uniref:G_PROTEIN_RECEP_F1_2 domain-containing protein n=1 Tax=Toxocara canis TaxID=6265 RepID=A0A0B2VTX6_TOXCA|nr:hypothetical protein Tcan_07483 [Toxocara canis]